MVGIVKVEDGREEPRVSVFELLGGGEETYTVASIREGSNIRVHGLILS